jgi:predicted ABC-type ATPase
MLAGLKAFQRNVVTNAFSRNYPGQPLFNQFVRLYSNRTKPPHTFLTQEQLQKLANDEFNKISEVSKIKTTEVTSQKFKSDSVEFTTKRTQSVTFKPVNQPVKPANIAKKPIKKWKLSEIFNRKQIKFYEELQRRCLQYPQVKLTAEETAHLVAKNYGTGAAKKGKVLHLVIGPPGSGKSSVIVNPLRDKYGAMVIDSDFIKPQIRGYEGGLGGNAVHSASAQIASQLLVKAMENGDNIIHPTTGYCEQYILELIKKASEKGYKVGLHLVDLSAREAAKRVLKRAEVEIGGVRQIVNLEYTLNVVGNRPRKVFRHIVTKHPEKIHEYSHHNNKVKKGEKAKLIKKSETEIANLEAEGQKPDPNKQ